MYKKYIKRILDVFLSTFALLFLAPLLLVVIVILAFANRGAGVLFFQDRPGRGGEIFKVIKLKTMNDFRSADGSLLPDAKRITAAGRIIRALSLDELPQLINVIKGDMSLVGPRPLMVKYLPLYNSFQARRHEVRPGITGWAQVNGRNAISWNERFELDIHYVDNVTFVMDLKIVLMTAVKVVLRSGVNSSDDVPMEPFKGNEGI